MAKKGGSGDIPLWGIFLLFLGVVFLLQTMNIIPWALWGSLWRFWPVLIVIAGLYILLRHNHAWFATIVILLLLFGCLGLALWQSGPGKSSAGTKTYSQPLAGVLQARVNLDFAAGQLTVGSLPAGSSNLVEATSLNQVGIRTSFSIKDGQGILDLSRESGSSETNPEARWEIRLARNVPIIMTVKASAAQSRVDLTDLKVLDLNVETNAGNMDMTLPAGNSLGVIKANAANIGLTVPNGVAARIVGEAKLGAIDVDEKRFPRSGGYYASPNYDISPVRTDLRLDCNVGRISVK